MFPERTPELQAPLAEQICRGALRILSNFEHHGMTEVSLANGRRADILALGPKGQITIVEVKSGVADFRSDTKWPEYQPFCDQFLFAVHADFPQALIPDEAGLIVSDAYGGAIVREAPEDRLSAARRKAVTLKFARVAAMRLNANIMPPLDAQVTLT